MRSQLLSLGMGLALILGAPVKPAVSGGFDRFGQNIDLLFDRANGAVETAVTLVAPQRSYRTVNGAHEPVEFLPDVALPSIAIKLTPADDTACLLSASETFGSDLEYPSNWSQAPFITTQYLDVDELALTCSYGRQFGSHYARVIGGASRGFASFEQRSEIAITGGGTVRPNLSFDGESTNWRAGLSLEKPETAFRVTAMYYSELDFELDGLFRAFPLANGTFVGSVPVEVRAAIPQALDVSVRGMVAPGWLMGGWIKWMDWSKFDQTFVAAAARSGPIEPGAGLVDFKTYFRDGWTVSGFAGHSISKDLFVFANVAWDRGVSTGWTEHTDTWSTLAGASYQISSTVELRGGVGVALLVRGEIDKTTQGGLFDATLENDYAVFTQLSLTIRQ